MRYTILCISLLALASCSGTSEHYNHYNRDYLNDERMTAWEELDAVKARVNKTTAPRQMQEFVGCGTMFAWEPKLGGGTGTERMMVSFAYKNTEEKNFDMVRVYGEVRDADNKVQGRKEQTLSDMRGYAISPGDVLSGKMEIPTNGAHLKEGWSWRIGCEPVAMKQLPPVRANR